MSSSLSSLQTTNQIEICKTEITNRESMPEMYIEKILDPSSLSNSANVPNSVPDSVATSVPVFALSALSAPLPVEELFPAYQAEQKPVPVPVISKPFSTHFSALNPSQANLSHALAHFRAAQKKLQDEKNNKTSSSSYMHNSPDGMKSERIRKQGEELGEKMETKSGKNTEKFEKQRIECGPLNRTRDSECKITHNSFYMPGSATEEEGEGKDQSNIKYADALSACTDKNTKKNRKRQTSAYLRKYEEAAVVGHRATEISQGAPILIKLTEGETDAVVIARKELYKGVLNGKIIRVHANGEEEVWYLWELKIPLPPCI